MCMHPCVIMYVSCICVGMYVPVDKCLCMHVMPRSQYHVSSWVSLHLVLWDRVFHDLKLMHSARLAGQWAWDPSASRFQMWAATGLCCGFRAWNSGNACRLFQIQSAVMLLTLLPKLVTSNSPYWFVWFFSFIRAQKSVNTWLISAAIWVQGMQLFLAEVQLGYVR